MIGVSPTRPTGLLVMPPVDVAAARWPSASRATARRCRTCCAHQWGRMSQRPAAAGHHGRAARPPARPVPSATVPIAAASRTSRVPLAPGHGSSELVTGRAGKQQMRAVPHHCLRGQHRIAGTTQPGHGTRAQVAAVHHAGVELVRAGGGVDRALAGIEELTLLQPANRLDHHGQRTGACAAAAGPPRECRAMPAGSEIPAQRSSHCAARCRRRMDGQDSRALCSPGIAIRWSSRGAPRSVSVSV